MVDKILRQKFEFSRQNKFSTQQLRPLAVFCKSETGPRIEWKVV